MAKAMKKDKETEEFLKLLLPQGPPEPKTPEEIRQEQKFRGSWIQGRVNVVYQKEIKQLRGKRP